MAERPAQARKGHRWFAALYDTMNRLSGTEPKFLAKHRPYIAGEANGRVLEIGAGTGASLPYYTKAETVVATEPDPYMLERARKRLDELGLTHIELSQHPAEHLGFDDHSFDHVVSVVVLCSVRDLRQSLAEVKRVLKPDGSFRFVEHVRFESGLKGRIQDLITPVQRWLFAGCHPNRRTLNAIVDAGFEVQDLQRYSMSPIHPVIVGVARPR